MRGYLTDANLVDYIKGVERKTDTERVQARHHIYKAAKMIYDFDSLRQSAEKLSMAIAQLPDLEADDLAEEIYRRTFMNLADMQTLTSALVEILKPEA